MKLASFLQSGKKATESEPLLKPEAAAQNPSVSFADSSRCALRVCRPQAPNILYTFQGSKKLDTFKR